MGVGDQGQATKMDRHTRETIEEVRKLVDYVNEHDGTFPREHREGQELDVATCFARWYQKKEGILVSELRNNPNDPPDCLARVDDRVIGVSSRSRRRHRGADSRGQPRPSGPRRRSRGIRRRPQPVDDPQVYLTGGTACYCNSDTAIVLFGRFGRRSIPPIRRSNYVYRIPPRHSHAPSQPDQPPDAGHAVGGDARPGRRNWRLQRQCSGAGGSRH